MPTMAPQQTQDCNLIATNWCIGRTFSERGGNKPGFWSKFHERNRTLALHRVAIPLRVVVP